MTVLCGAGRMPDQEAAMAGVGVSSRPFVGRGQEMKRLLDALERCAGGQAALVMLAGEPGIGKTRVAEELSARAGERGAEVLWGRC